MNCEFSERAWSSPISYDNLTVEDSIDTTFYGFSLDWHEGIGGHIVLGLEVKKAVVLWEQADNAINIAPPFSYRGRH